MNRIFTRQWFEATGIRMIKTFAEGALAVIGTGLIGITDVNWGAVLATGAMASVVSFLLALKGLPEVCESDEDGEKE